VVPVKVLVTGGRGFAGTHLVRHLVGCGDDVVVTDRATGGPDLLDADAWTALVADVRPEAVYHLAAQPSVAASWADPALTLRINAEGTLHVLLACRDAGVRRVLVVSTSDVYGGAPGSEQPLREDAPLRPVTPYAASKAAAEQLALQAWLGWGLEVVRVRPFNHIGPGQDDRFVAGALAARVAAAEAGDGDGTVPVGNLSARRDFTDVRDVVRAYRAVLDAGEPGEVYHVCSGRAVAIAELAEALAGLAHRPVRLVPDPALLRPVDTPLLVGDASKLTAATGWAPTIALADTLRDLLADHRVRLGR
jgi:GDP-4-dehydro-6-deoxy-D-mannose reductase